MDWKKIAPWNWFKDEGETGGGAVVPVRRDAPGDPFMALRSEMDRWFDDAFRRTAAGFPALFGAGEGVPALLRPKLDISEGKKAYTVRADLPGVERSDVSLEVDGQTLTIRAEKRRETEEEDEGYHCLERSYGAVQRVLSLPDDADAEAIDAKFRNGVLKLRIPKHAAKARRGHSIEIQED